MTVSLAIETSWAAEPFVPASRSRRADETAAQIRAGLVEDLRRAHRLAGAGA